MTSQINSAATTLYDLSCRKPKVAYPLISRRYKKINWYLDFGWEHASTI